MSLGNAARRGAFVEPKLQITAMMDMFTIIVFFLLFSYAEKPDEIKVDRDIDLPVSSSERDYENTIKVFLSDSTLKIEEKVVAKIVGDKIVGFNANKPESSYIYKTLEKLKEEKTEEKEEISQSTPDTIVGEKKSETTPQVLFFCDKSVPFKVINTVMKTIGMVGYPNMQFAVTGGQ